MIRLFLADDHQMFRQGLFSMLDKVEDIEIVGEANDGLEALKKIEDVQPDVVILDVAMPGMEGIEVARRVRKHFPQIRILMLTMHADKYYAVEALKAGAHAFLLKEESFTRLIDAIKEKDQKKIILSPTLEDTVLSDFAQKTSEDKSRPGTLLTAREREILKLITEGITNQEIGDRLFISPSTVDTHRKNIMAKLDIHSVAGLVKFAIRHKIVSP
jgi:DNA-binding NarL/FixJ family response regulator